jgi:2-oxoglutarate dehydrogenase E2 component (dihydrolipoamide succinyltransferase)
MSVQITVPMLPESVADATVLTWHKHPGDAVTADEILVELETDKVVLEVPAPHSGVLQMILQGEGKTVAANDILALIDTTTATINKATPTEHTAANNPTEQSDLSPAVRRLVAEKGVDATQLQGSGKNGRITKSDVVAFLDQKQSHAQPIAPVSVSVPVMGERAEQRVPMSRLRAKVAERLLSAQHDTAMLTTFNEVNLQAIMDLRKRYKEAFEKKHGIRLGFMSFFTKAVIEALREFPAVNASIDGKDVVYHGYFDIGIAVSTPRGLVVPVLRDADKMSLADIEHAISNAATKAKENKLTIEEITGGTFTITNGGVFGSLLSTPILNPPQSAILGMHKIEDRAVVEEGQIVVRPMMYLAMSYDHRIIDGKESVSFLVTIKNYLEDPNRLLLEI